MDKLHGTFTKSGGLSYVANSMDAFMPRSL